MPLMAREGEARQKQLPPAGTHVARCYSVIDLGTQDGAFGSRHKVRVTWELPEEKAVFKEEDGPQPFVLSKEYTLSLFEKANLRHDLEAWRGKEFTAEELKGFDIFSLLGVPCMLTVVHKTTPAGKTFANVQGVGKMPKGVPCPPQINESVQFEITDGRSIAFERMPRWLQEKIEASEEWDEFPEPPEDLDDKNTDNDTQIPF